MVVYFFNFLMRLISWIYIMAMSTHQDDPNTDRIINIIREVLYVVYFLDYIMMFEFIFEMQSAMLTLSSHSWD